MRTKNAKRLWPVPVTLAVMVLATFLAFGFLAVNGAQPAAAQADDPCITIPDSGATTPEGDACNVSGTSAIVKFTGLAVGVTEFSFYVYGADLGDGDPVAYQPGTEYTAADGFHIITNSVTTQVAPLRFQLVEVDAPKNQGTGLAASSSTLTINGEPGSSATLYVYRGGDGPTTLPILEAESVSGVKVDLPSTGLTTIAIKFLGPAAKGSSTARLSDIGALLQDAPPSNGDAYVLNKKVRFTNLPEVSLVAKVLDADGNELDGKIVYHIEYMARSSVEPGRSSYSTQPDDYPDDTDAADHFMGTYDASIGVVTGHMLKVTGWKTSGPVAVKVIADFIREGDTSPSLKLGPVTISRAGALDSVAAMTCVADTRPAAQQDKNDGCGMTMRPRSVFAPVGTFMIDPKSLDALGTEITDANTQPRVTLPDGKTSEGNPVVSSVAADVGKSVPAHYAIDVKAPPGSYDIEVKATERKGGTVVSKSKTLTIIVSGPPVMYEVTGPENISLAAFSAGEYTIKATDVAGNPPDFGKDEDMVSVVVESELSVRVTGLDNGVAMLDAETGMDTFTVYKPANAMRGDTASIGIFVGDELMDQLNIVFGEPVMVPSMPMTDTSLQAITASSIEVTNNANSSITVNWMGGDNADSFIVVAAELGSDPFTYVPKNVAGDAAKMATISGLNSGSNYMVIVIALQGTNFQYGVLLSVMAN